MEVLRSQTLADGVENRLLEYIQSSGLKPGDLMPKEEELAEQLCVSRHIVREGVSRLKSLGLVESRKRRGMTLSRPNAFAGVSKLAEAKIFSPEECREFMEIRVIMELGMADFIYERKTPEKIAELRALVQEYSKSPPHEAELPFHGALYAISGNQTANQFRQLLATAFEPHRRGAKSTFKGTTSSHLEICEVLEHGSLEEFRSILKAHFIPYINW